MEGFFVQTRRARGVSCISSRSTIYIATLTRNEEDPSALDLLSFATFLYENEAKTGPLLKIPEQFTDDE